MLLFTASMWCRRLSPEQSQASAQALHSTCPDDDFVIAMIRHWWHPAASARDADQSTNQGQLQAPLGNVRAGQPQGQQPFVALPVGNLQAAADGQLAKQLLAEGAEGDQESQQGCQQNPEAVTAHLHYSQAEGTLHCMPPGNSQEQSFRIDVQPHIKQGLPVEGDERYPTDESYQPVHLTSTVAEAVKAIPPDPGAESTVQTVNAGGLRNIDTNDSLYFCLLLMSHLMLH